MVLLYYGCSENNRRAEELRGVAVGFFFPFSRLKPFFCAASLMTTTQSTRSIITLKGSVEIVTEFFGYSINSILYQRGIYPPESFTSVRKYGLPMMITKDEGLKKYLG